MSTLITIDNGGTLTDVCVIDGDSVTYTKTLTTPHDLSRCLFDGLSKVAEELDGAATDLTQLLQKTDYIRYSTTQGTNALVQRKGPKLGLLVGQQEVLAELSDDADSGQLLDALVGGRCAALDLDADDEALSAQLVTVCNALAAAGANRIVVSLEGPDGPEQERRVRRLALTIFPRHLLGALPFLYSHDLVGGDNDDVRRTWSSLLNAFLHPAMERFLFNAEDRLREHRTRNPLLVFRNDGASSRVAKSSALKTYSSGPRGGVEGTRVLADHYDLSDVVMVDVGGTTTDVARVVGGSVEIDQYGQVEGVATSLPLARIVSHGIGGSSIFSVVDGVVTVGPGSVGAAPGPACFGLGGDEATITDVLLLSGVLDSSTYLGGSLSLDVDRSAAVVQAKVAEPLGVDLEEALRRMREAYAERLALALREVVDSSSTVVAVGGAGPMSVALAARAAGVKRVLVPRFAAVFSAFGIAFSDIGQTYTAALGEDEQQIRAGLLSQAERDMFAEGIALADCEQRWSTIEDPDGSTRMQLLVRSTLPHPQLDRSAATPQALTTVDSRTVRLGDGDQKVPVVELLEQPIGAFGEAPAVVEGPFFTLAVPDGWRIEITPAGDLLLTDHDTL